MRQHRILLIINPIAGTSKKKGLEGYVASRLLRCGCKVDVEFTRGPGDATRLAKQSVENGFDAVLAAGGDGTVNETASALTGTGVALGIVPCGSGNGLARHLHIPVDVAEGLDVIEEDHIEEIDYGQLNGRDFFCTCGVGFDAMVSEKFAAKGTRGLSTYVKSVIEEYRNYSPEEYSLTIDGKPVVEKAFLIAVCNASQYGNNAYIAPDARINDGLLDVTVVHAGNLVQTALMAFDLVSGNLSKNRLVTTYRASRLTISRRDAGAVHLDGEPLRLGPEIEISCQHRGLKVFTPSKKYRFTPFLSPVVDFMRDFRLRSKHILGIR